LRPAWPQGVEVPAVCRDASDARPSYFIELRFDDGKIALIRDFRYVSPVAQDAVFASIQ